ncbi:uncharacterized protein LOC104906104 [Beta vulgaris subsp. vulgaris]|uniref:uncharacterized protein LOC104906104 n=1 Tax=Beta vulgaris subsp. vulgaris TaxID=3555 RepID=UPI002036CED0|nr:uncharacterized protein LOC104906104 [Beta vulgaris subsp. vulgaris]
MEDASATFLTEGISDHFPCIINLDNTILRRARSFKYCNMWSMAEEFMDIVDEYGQQNVSENETLMALTKLTTIQTEIHTEPLNLDLHHQEEAAMQEYQRLNKEKKNADQLYRIQNVADVWKEDSQGIEEAFVQYYEGLLGTDDNTCYSVSESIVKEGPILTSEHQHKFCVPFTEADVKAAVFDIDDTTAAGPYGYSSNFIKKAWDRIGNDISQAVLNFIHFRKILKQINATTLCLVPKCERPQNVTQFRPIACCNVIYKVISKITCCSRLNEVLPVFVDQLQSAFIEKRMIMHNILICQDMLKQYIEVEACLPGVQ